MISAFWRLKMQHIRKNKTVVAFILFFGTEFWIIYHCHTHYLERFHQCCLHTIFNIRAAHHKNLSPWNCQNHEDWSYVAQDTVELARSCCQNGRLLPIDCSVGWGCRIHRLLLCRGVRPPPTSVLDMTLNNLMVKFQ